MSIRNLDRFFNPRSVVVIGASDRPHSIGATVFSNLLTGGFSGPIMAVNSVRPSVQGQPAWPNVAALPECPDLAVICTPPATIPDIVKQLGERGTKAAIVISAGLGKTILPDGRPTSDAMLQEARPHLLRIIGPNCLGLLVPGAGLNASFAPGMANVGKLAFISQSGALATAVLDWGNAEGIGFSCFLSVGDSLDVDFGDLIDYLARDPKTTAILLYIESIKNPRKFMSAARAASRSKPLIAVKSGRVSAGARAAFSHTGALAGDDDIVDAVLRRAGVLRVDTTQDLFAAAATLARARKFVGPRVALMTNGGGAGVMATDALITGGGMLATLSAETTQRLDERLPATWSRSNPLDIIGDAPTERYVETLKILLAAPEIDSVLFMHAPTAIVESFKIAQGIIPIIEESAKSVFTCFLGGSRVAEARHLLRSHGILGFLTPEEAVRAILMRDAHSHLRTLLTETPSAALDVDRARLAQARSRALSRVADGNLELGEVEAKEILALAGIPVLETRAVSNIDEAVSAATSMGYPVALKILSPTITHKSDVGGVELGIADGSELRRKAEAMEANIRLLCPDAVLAGFTVQPMVSAGSAHELILGCVSDPAFGPVLMVGQGGVAVEVVRDRSFGLPPLCEPLARDMLERTKIWALLQGYRNTPRADIEAVIQTLLRLSALVCACPALLEIDINPLRVDARGVIALDARMKLGEPDHSPVGRLIIQPYPDDLEAVVRVGEEQLYLRPIKPEDELLHASFLASLTIEDVYSRFFQLVKEWTHDQVARLTQIDYDREMSFVLISGKNEIVAVSRTSADPDNLECEFAIVVRGDYQNFGVGQLMMKRLIDYSRQRGTAVMTGYILARNSKMLGLASDLGFSFGPPDDSGVVKATLSLGN